jgi:large subunit ribosomal protein L25
MATASLSAELRADVGKGVARKLRAAGRVPGVIYGHARKPQSLSIGARDLLRLVEQVSWENTVVELSVDGATTRTLIREIQRHPVKRDILHVDFQELVAGEKVSVNIPVRLVGTPAGVRTSGGIMNQVMFELQVKVDPAHIPTHFDVDVNDVNIGHSLHVSDIKVPDGIDVLHDADETVMTVVAPKAAEEETVAPQTEAPAEPELIRKPKEEEEGGEE